jgi:glutamate/tyrosine decarboxylase-like PLP-dependent enzyme
LSSPSTASDFTIPSPLNIGIENSRRFRALPVYAVLVAHGRSGLSEMFARQVRLARLIAASISAHSGYELLPANASSSSQESAATSPSHADTGIIVLFRAVDPAMNSDLAARINRSGKIMVSGTAWEGKPAVRIAVSTWMVEEERDLRVVREVLERALL